MHPFIVYVITEIGMGMLTVHGCLLYFATQHPSIPFVSEDDVSRVVIGLASPDVVGNEEDAYMCLVCKILNDAIGNDLLTSDHYRVLSDLSEGRFGPQIMEAIFQFNDGFDFDDSQEMKNVAELFKHMMCGTLCPHALASILKSLNEEAINVHWTVYRTERDMRIGKLLASRG